MSPLEKKPLFLLVLVGIVTLTVLTFPSGVDHKELLVRTSQSQNPTQHLAKPATHLHSPSLLSYTKSPTQSAQKEDSPSLSGIAKVAVWGGIRTGNNEVAAHEKIVLLSPSLRKRYTAATDEYGEFYFPEIVPAEDYVFSVDSKELFQRYEQHVSVDLNTSPINVVLSELPVGQFLGLIRNSRGEPIPDLKLRIKSLAKPSWRTEIVSNTLGEFDISEMPIGPLEFSYHLDFIMRASGYEFLGEQLSPMVLVIDQGEATLVGAVYDQFNQPVGGANVLLNWEYVNEERRNVVFRRTTTRSDGQFSFESLGEGVHDLVLSFGSEGAFRQTVNIFNNFTNLTVVLDLKAPEV